MLTIVLSMLAFALVGAISPGPVNIVATGAGANYGFRGALPHVLGATLSYTLIVFLVGAGLNRLLIQFPDFAMILQYAGGAFLLWMAWKIASARPENLQSDKQSEPPRLLEGALCQLLNPKAWLVSASGVSLFVSSQQPAELFLLIFCTVSFAMCLIGVGSWALLGQLISRYLSNPVRQVMFNRVMAALLVASILTIINV
ncbi:LysE family translocator [Aliamphritea spongicola]|uniref:LysE family translocator n=1 Tax=Aliamphritea spongicola TaxID=707589 RepID=UPI00196BA26E|nr:LysE family translocator [Aliamphritea spongicola]MBN3562100.1 LysE family translocator [Aliamphritea spongicola]